MVRISQAWVWKNKNSDCWKKCLTNALKIAAQAGDGKPRIVVRGESDFMYKKHMKQHKKNEDAVCIVLV